MASIAYHHEQQRRSPDQVAARANLLTGLRTGRQRSDSPVSSDQIHMSRHHAQAAAAAHLKANAPVFTPQQQSTPPASDYANANSNGDYLSSLESQLAALQMSAMHSTPNVAASYGLAQGQPQHAAQQQYNLHQEYLRQNQHQHVNEHINQQAVTQFLRQRQAQQQQLLQQQQAAAQQRALFAHIQAEYEQQALAAEALSQQQQQQQHLAHAFMGNSAHEQRQAAQASIQANLRNRQAQQLYTQLVEEEEQGLLDRRAFGGRDLWQVALDAVNEEHERAHLANTQEQLRLVQLQQYNLQLQQLQQQAQQVQQAQQAQQAANEASTASPKGQQARQPQQSTSRERTVSTADKAVSWRNRPVNNPSIVVDDSDSDSASPRSSRSIHSADDTAQTSEEDVEVTSLAAATDKLGAGAKTKYGSVARGVPSTAPAPRVPSYSAAQRARESKDASPLAPVAAAAQGQVIIPACRQPRGPPTDFQASNFASRINARTRKEALNKLRLCSSPRIVSTGMV